MKWSQICKTFCPIDDSFLLHSYKFLTAKSVLVNRISWNLKFLFSLKDTFSMENIITTNLYREYLIVISYKCVKYLDMRTLQMTRLLEINECFDFQECDTFVLRSTQSSNREHLLVNLLLCGKSNYRDYGFENIVQRIMFDRIDDYAHSDSILKIKDVTHYMINNDCCYVMDSNKVLHCYIWQDDKTWAHKMLGRYYGLPHNLLYAMNVYKADIVLLFKWGQLLFYSYRMMNFEEFSLLCMPPGTMLVRIVHKYCVVIGVAKESVFRITRHRNNKGYTFYKFECPNLTCVTQHGDMLFLGFGDGRIEIYKPKAQSREDMFRHRLYISDFKQKIDTKDLYIKSIQIFEDIDTVHHMFIATGAGVYHLLVTHPEGCVWDHLPEKEVHFKHPIMRRER